MSLPPDKGELPLIRLDGGCSVRGETALGGCTRCGRSICHAHRIVSDAGLTDTGPSEVFCPACWGRRGVVRKSSDALESLKLGWNLLVFAAIVVGSLYGLLAYLLGWK
jgi:hypothetical protein